jgi:cytidylate kinase
MDEDRSAVSSMRAITISRQYGSGGGEIAARIAEHLGWELIDHEVVVRVAQELGVTEAEAEAYDERTESVASRILATLQAIQPTIPVAPPVLLTTDAHDYNEARRRVIEGAVAAGQAVIVGRGAQVLLAQRRDVLHVRVVAPLDKRIIYVMHREGLDQNAARARIQLKDRDRTRYLQVEHNKDSGDPTLYDLIVNTSILDLDSVVDLLIFALECKARQLSKLIEELGPDVGLPRYPGQPGDFRPPESITGPQA